MSDPKSILSNFYNRHNYLIWPFFLTKIMSPCFFSWKFLNRLGFVFCISPANTGHIGKLHLFGSLFLCVTAWDFLAEKNPEVSIPSQCAYTKNEGIQTHKDNQCRIREEIWFTRHRKCRSAKCLLCLESVISTIKPSLQDSQVTETKGTIWRKEDEKMQEKNHVREYLRESDIHKSIIHDGIHPQFLRELVDVIEREGNAIPVFRQGKEDDSGAIDWSALVPLKVFKEINII